MEEKRGEVVELVRRRSTQNYQTEKDQQGWIIQEAYYGDRNEIEQLRRISLTQNIHPASLVSQFSKVIDVTIPLQFYVKDSRLQLQKGSKKGLIGFGFPEGLKESDAALYIK